MLACKGLMHHKCYFADSLISWYINVFKVRILPLEMLALLTLFVSWTKIINILNWKLCAMYTSQGMIIICYGNFDNTCIVLTLSLCFLEILQFFSYHSGPIITQYVNLYISKIGVFPILHLQWTCSWWCSCTFYPFVFIQI